MTPRFDRLEDRCVLSAADLLTATAVSVPTRPPGTSGPVGAIEVSGQIVADGASNLYRINLDSNVRLRAQLRPAGLDTLLSLLDDQGNTLIQSETSAIAPGGEIDLSLPVGTYYVAVASRSGTGAYDLKLDTFDVALARKTVPSAVTPATAGTTRPILSADFEATGIPFLAIANPDAGTITLKAGQGDGTFVAKSTMHVGGRPSALLSGDFNGDGRLDLAVADAQSGEVLILLGLGDGTFLDPVAYKVGSSPESMVAGDFSGSGRLDIAVADAGSNDVTILHGMGDGTFQVGSALAVGAYPIAVVAADFQGDGRTDLVTANRGSGDLTILNNLGGGVFLPSTWRGPSMSPSALLATDLTGGGMTDLVIADHAHNRILILWNRGGGEFSPAQSFDVGKGPNALAAADLNNTGDGSHDLVVANSGSNELTIFRGWEGNTYRHRYTIALDLPPAGLEAVDLNGDGLPDLVIASASKASAEVYLSRGDGVFTPPEATVPLPHSPPLVVFSSSVLSLDQSGRALLRLPRPGSPGEFESPTVETADGAVNRFRDIISLTTVEGWAAAALDWQSPQLVLAYPTADLQVEYSYIQLPVGGIYTRLAAGSFERNGRDDLAILDQASNQVLIVRQDASGQFHLDRDPIGVGFAPTDITVADLNQDGWPDLVVANGGSGDISIVHGGPGGVFGPEVRFRGGLSPAGTDLVPGGLVRTSPDQPVGVTTGVFDSSGLTDVVVVERGVNRISVLKGTPGGGLADPSPATTYSTGAKPTQAVAAPLGRDGRLDLAVLNEGSQDISIFMNDGRGGFITMPRVAAGFQPTGLAVQDLNGDGLADLVVGNALGDILVLLGNGDGTFRPYNRADRTVNLAVGDLTGDGQPDFVFSDTSQDLLSVQYPGKTASFFQGRKNGLRAPGPVAIADLNGDGIPDLVVTDRGGNDVLVYLGQSGGGFADPLKFPTGTAPVGLTIADLTGDGTPDLVVANEGSNDLSILLGRGHGDHWTLTPGPRLHVGERPVSTTVADVNGDGRMDILCVNQDSDTVTLLTGLGGGFFDDRNPKTFATGPGPIQAFFGRFSEAGGNGLVILNSLSSTMTYYADPLSGTTPPLTLSTGGVGPVAGVMGDFDKDGYSDLIIANSGDSRLSLFQSGIGGLALTKTYSLDSSIRLSSLVVVPVKPGDLQLFVGTEGHSQAISVFLTTAGSSQAQAAGPGLPAPSGGSSATGASFGPATSAFAALVLNTSSVEGEAMAFGLQGQASVQAGVQVGGSSGPAAAGAIPAAQALAPFLGAPFSSAGMLIEALVQMRQAPTSDVLPLMGNEGALVAVILSLTGASDPVPVPNGNDSPLVGLVNAQNEVAGMSMMDPEWSPALARDRFLLNPDPTLSSVQRELGAHAGLSPRYGPEWVWRRSRTESSEVFMAAAEIPRLTAAERATEPPGQASRGVAMTNQITTDCQVASAEPLGVGVGGVGPSLKLAKTALGAIVVGVAVIAAWKRRDTLIQARRRSSTGKAGRPHWTALRSRAAGIAIAETPGQSRRLTARPGTGTAGCPTISVRPLLLHRPRKHERSTSGLARASRRCRIEPS